MAVSALFLLPLAGQSMAQSRGRLVDCRVESSGKVEVSGKCRFATEAGGSFTLSSPDANKALFGSILMVTVSIVSAGDAEVRGLTRDGINSRWGAARRSSRDRACWEGSDFRVCAW